MNTKSERPIPEEPKRGARVESRAQREYESARTEQEAGRRENVETNSVSAADLEAERLAGIECTPESLASTPSEAGKAPPGHPAESPRGWGLLVTIVGLIVLAVIIWAVFF